MRILIFHGYPLRGTGSNVYNAELARVLAADGHDVDLFCQDPNPAELDFVDAVGDWSNGSLTINEIDKARPQQWGSCRAFRPPIGKLLPVYVFDRYPGFEAKVFGDLSEAELDHYIERNVAAVREVCTATPPDRALANHILIGPCVLARALPEEVTYAVKIHGSAIEYTLRPNPRFLPLALEGLERAATVLVGSTHIAERLADSVPLPEIVQRVFLGPPGVDVARFVPRPRDAARAALAEVADRVGELEQTGYGHRSAAATAALYGRISGPVHPPIETIADEIRLLHAAYDPSGTDQTAPDALRAVAAAGDARAALFVGKLIVSKGVDLLLAAWPLVLEQHRGARLVIAGYGAYREGLEMLLASLSIGDLRTAELIAAGGRAFEGGAAEPLKFLSAFLDSLQGDRRDRYVEAAAGMRETVHWLGRIEHDLLSVLTPACDVQVVPSTFPEAFGMVAAEAAACGVPPVCARHSGLAEVVGVLEQRLSGSTASLLSFEIGETAVERLASRINGLFALERQTHADLCAGLVNTARDNFSWTRTAHDVVLAAGGEHRGLIRPKQIG